MSNTDKQLQQTKDSIDAIFKVLNIKHVYYIDDVFEESPDISKIIGWITQSYRASPEATQKIVPATALDSPPEVVSQSLRKHLAEITPEQQKFVLSSVAEILGNSLAIDIKVAHGLRALFPDQMDVQTFSPNVWVTQRDIVLKDANRESRILCLFDHNLELSPGFASTGSRSGIGLIQEIIALDSDGHIICGLFTHTIKSLEEEMPIWRSISSENSLPLNRFLPITKLRYSSGNPLEFADGIKKTTLNLYCEMMKKTALGVLDSAHEHAKEQVKSIDVYDFDSAILQSSYAEGEWEADTLVRIFHIFQKDRTRQSLFSTAEASSFNNAVKIARAISAITTIQDPTPSHNWAAITRRTELYEKASLQHSSLQIGDIFELLNGDKTTSYILLAQPCDLMVRPKKLPRLDGLVVPIVPITESKPYKDIEKQKTSYWRNHTPLFSFFESEPDKVAILNFTETIWIRREVLDLAVLNVAGNCTLDLNVEISLPLQLTDGWHNHIVQIIEKFKAERTRLDELEISIAELKSEEARARILSLHSPQVTLRDSWMPGEIYSKGIFDFHLRRVNRYRQPKANSLLNTFTHYLSREAEEHDFSR